MNPAYARMTISKVVAKLIWFEMRDSDPDKTVTARALAYRLSQDENLSRKELVLLGFAGGYLASDSQLQSTKKMRKPQRRSRKQTVDKSS